MWFKDHKGLEKLLKPIKNIRPLIEKRYEKTGRVIGVTSFSRLHYCFILTLRKITVKTNLPAVPTSLRVFEMDQNGFVAIHDVSHDEKNPELNMTFLSELQSRRFDGAIQKIKTIHTDETKGEIRLLHVPALNAEAVWLHFGDGKDDKFTLMNDFDPKENELYSKKDFITYLHNQKKNLGEMTRLMGA